MDDRIPLDINCSEAREGVEPCRNVHSRLRKKLQYGYITTPVVVPGTLVGVKRGQRSLHRDNLKLRTKIEA